MKHNTYHKQAKHNEQETNLTAADAKLMANKQSACEISLTEVNVSKDKNIDNGKTIVTAANVTKDAEGKTRAMTITTEGAGTAFNIPFEGNKEFAGVQVTHEATGITEDEEGVQKLFMFIRFLLTTLKSELKNV